MQTCTAHLLRAATRFASYSDRKKVAAALRPIYTASTDEAARLELDAFAASTWGKRYPAAFPPELRKIIYTANTIESLNYQLRKIIQSRGHFPPTTPRSS